MTHKGTERKTNMAPKIDFTGVETSFKPLDEGIYPAQLAGWKFEEASKSSGKPYMTLEFDVEAEGSTGRKAWLIQSLQPQSLWRLKKTLIILGADEDSIDGELDLEEDVLPGLKGNKCSLALIIDKEYDADEPRNKVAKVLPEGIGNLPF